MCGENAWDLIKFHNINESSQRTYIFSTASDISGQNSSTMLSNFFKANTFNSGIGSSRREIIPAN
jgi:hypothetical protein